MSERFSTYVENACLNHLILNVYCCFLHEFGDRAAAKAPAWNPIETVLALMRRAL
jgi:hypothetical protein